MHTILITGASRGIGLEMARQYGSDAGWQVYACCRRPEAAAELGRIAAVRRSGSEPLSESRITVLPLDVTDAAQIRSLSQRLSGPIDILLNNAGVYGQHEVAFGNLDEASWLEGFRVNAIAPLKMAEAFLEHVAHSELKIIATISSKMGSIADNVSGGYYPYRSSKAAVNMVMRSMSVDLAARGIIVVTLNPGWVRTDMGGPRAPLSAEESVADLRRVLARVAREDSGKFLDHDGSEIPW